MRIRTGECREFIDVTGSVAESIPDGFSGAVLIHVPHTTAGVTLNEGFDPDVVTDITCLLQRLVPHGMQQLHSEGNSDAHALASLIGTSVLLPVTDGSPSLGRWQRIFFCEFDGPRTREIGITLLPGVAQHVP